MNRYELHLLTMNEHGDAVDIQDEPFHAIECPGEADALAFVDAVVPILAPLSHLMGAAKSRAEPSDLALMLELEDPSRDEAGLDPVIRREPLGFLPRVMGDDGLEKYVERLRQHGGDVLYLRSPAWRKRCRLV